MQYIVHQAWRLQTFVPAPATDINELREPHHRLDLLERTLDEYVVDPPTRVRDLARDVVDNVRCVVGWFSCALLSTIFSAQLPAVLYSVPLGTRTQVKDLIPQFPAPWVVAALRKRFNVRTRTPAAVTERNAAKDYVDAVCELPQRKRRRAGADTAEEPPPRRRCVLDPIRQLKAMLFSRHLKSQHDFAEAMADAFAFQRNAEPEDRDRSRDVSRATLDRGAGRLDALGCLLHRRTWHADRMADAIECVNLVTDASPNSGFELQGMAAVIRRTDASWYVMNFPGSSLAYGMADAVTKCVALLWGIFLLCGPAYDDIAYVCKKVFCITTDFGLEILTVEMVNILPAFMRWIAGEPLESLGPYVRYGERLFPNAIRLYGWSHCFGNLAKGAAKADETWPKKLDQLRALVKFWRNSTWRTHCIKALRGRGVDTAPLKKAFLRQLCEMEVRNGDEG